MYILWTYHFDKLFVIGSLEIFFEGDWLLQVVSHIILTSLFYLPDKLICIFFLFLFPLLWVLLEVRTFIV